METVVDLIETTEFQTYCAAVKIAEKASGGSGELNIYDHVAKDLHKPGFDEEYEKMTENFILLCIWNYSNDLRALAKKYEKE